MADQGLPLVTVVVPCYNQARFLRDAVDSALAQTYPRVEVVVVSDGSPDDAAAVAAEYGDRIRFVEQENSGVSAARNTGIRMGTGEVLAFLDADDVLHPGCLERRVGMLIAEEDIGMVSGNLRFVDEDLNPTGVEGLDGAGPPCPQARHLLRGNWGGTCGTVVRRTALQRCGGFDPMLRACEDWDLQIRVSLRTRFVYDPVPMADARQVTGSLSRGGETMWDCAVQVLRKHRAYASNPWHFVVDAGFAQFNSLLMLMNRLRDERSGWPWVAEMARFAVVRPRTLPFFAMWLARFAKNGLVRVLSFRGSRTGSRR